MTDPHESPWWRSGVVYQIYPRSFRDADGDGVGDLPGITASLDHLNGAEDSLGVDAIWLSPFFPSPQADFGYDVADYCDVDPVFGTLADFDALVEGAHRRGIRVIVDFVLNHSSDRHPWFQASRSSRDDPKRDWYVWADGRKGGPPNRWESVFQLGPDPEPAWTLDPTTNQYYLHSFLPQQPDLNWWNPEVRAAMNDVVRFWLDRGVDGFRLDAVHRVGHDPELRDNVEGTPRRDEDLEVVHDVLRGLRRVIDGYDDRMTIGEVYLLDLARVLRYHGTGDELDLAFNFSFLNQPWSASGFRAQVERFEALLPSHAWPNYTLSNHDHPRAISRYDDKDGLGEARARLAAMMLLTLRGTPFLYYGEELGLRDVPIERSAWQDPVGRDAERTPMPWTPGPGAGFTTSERPWLPLNADADRVNVATESADEGSMLTLYRRLLAYRRGSTALRVGSQELLADNPDVFAFLRVGADARLLVALNFGGRRLALDAGGHGEEGRVGQSTDLARIGERVRLDRVELGPLEGAIVELAP